MFRGTQDLGDEFAAEGVTRRESERSLALHMRCRGEVRGALLTAWHLWGTNEHVASYIFTTWVTLRHWDSSNPRKDRVRPWSKGMMEASHAFEPGFIESRRAHFFFFRFVSNNLERFHLLESFSLRFLFEKNRFPGTPVTPVDSVLST